MTAPPLPRSPATSTPAGLSGLGFCLPCYSSGVVELAAAGGDVCAAHAADPAVVIPQHRSAPVEDGPEGWWRELAAGLAGQPQVWLGFWRTPPGGPRARAEGGRVQFDTRRVLTAQLPDQPAAVRVYSDAGLTPTLWLDFDPNRAPAEGPAAVERDAAAAVQLLTDHGARLIVDTSPRGGRHVIAPLAEPTALEVLEPLLAGLARRWPTLDTGPMTKLAQGCMAPPGALTRRHERRQLVTPFAEAREAVARRSAPGLVAGLLHALADDQAAALLSANRCTDPPEPAPPAPAPTSGRTGGQPPRTGSGGGLVVDERATARPGGARRLPVMVEAIVERGIWPAHRYPSPSEARMAALNAAAGRGWSLAQVRQRMDSGAWPGLAGLYAKYSDAWREKTLAGEWSKAVIYAAAHPDRPTGVAHDHTSRKFSPRGGDSPSSQAVRPVTNPVPDERRYLRRWHATLLHTAQQWARDETGWTRLAVLLACAVHAMRTSSRVISPGCRALTLAAGLLDHGTVAAVLRTERADPAGWVQLVEVGDGETADRYELVIPDAHATVWDARPLPHHAVDLVHPIYAPGLLGAGVGLAAWQVVTAIEAGADTVAQIVEATGVSRAQTYRAIKALAGVGIVRRLVSGAWRRTRRGLDRAGALVGLVDRVAARREQYEIARSLWRTLLQHMRGGRRDSLPAGGRWTTTTGPPDEALWWPGWQRTCPDDGDEDDPELAAAVGILCAGLGMDSITAVVA